MISPLGSVGAPIPWQPERPIMQPIVVISVFATSWITLATILSAIFGYYLSAGMLPKITPLLAVAAGLVCYTAAVRLFEGRLPNELSLKRSPELLLGALITGLFSLGLIALMLATGLLKFSGERFGIDPIATVLTVGILGAVWQELLFRGMIFRHTENLFGTWPALILSSVLLSFENVFSPDASVGSVLVLFLETGLAFGAIFIFTRSLWLVLGLRIAWHTIYAGVLGSPVDGATETGLLSWESDGNWLLSGSWLGIQGSVITVAMFAGVTVIFLLRARVSVERPELWVKTQFRTTIAGLWSGAKQVFGKTPVVQPKVEPENEIVGEVVEVITEPDEVWVGFSPSSDTKAEIEELENQLQNSEAQQKLKEAAVAKAAASAVSKSAGKAKLPKPARVKPRVRIAGSRESMRQLTNRQLAGLVLDDNRSIKPRTKVVKFRKVGRKEAQTKTRRTKRYGQIGPRR